MKDKKLKDRLTFLNGSNANAEKIEFLNPMQKEELSYVTEWSADCG